MSVPGTIGGGGKRPSNWWALAAAPIAALIAQGIGGVGFGEGLGAFGEGFAQEKYNQLRQRRQREFDEEGRTIDLAHAAVQDLKNVDSETLAKFPQLQSLSQKYQEALADDGKISAKEAKEIVILNQHLQADMKKAQTAQGLSNREAQRRSDAQLEENMAAEQMGRAFPGTEGGSLDEMRDVGQTLLDQQRMAEMPQLMNVNIGDQQRQILMNPKEQFLLAKEEERAERLRNEEARRQGIQDRIAQYQAGQAARAERGLSARENAADLRDQIQEWRDNKSDAMNELLATNGVEKPSELDPAVLREFTASWEQVRPRRGERPRIAPPPKVDAGKPTPVYGGKKYQNVRVK